MAALELDVNVRTEHDYSPDLSWLGEYHSNRRPGCIDREARGDAGRHEYQFWSPGMSLEDHRAGLRRMGYSKHSAYTLARGYVLRDYKRIESYGTDWWMEGVIVSVSLDEHALGEASLWGIESDAGDEYRAEIVAELTAEAVEEARRALVGMLEAVAALP